MANGTTNTQTTQQSQQLTPAQQAQQINLAARQAIKNSAVKMMQPLATGQIVPQNNPVLTIQPRNVGLILGFWVNVVHTIQNNNAIQLVLTDFGPLNALSQIQFNDFNNTVRIQTAGWHLGLINSIRFRRPSGAALLNSAMDSPVNYGDNFSGANGGGCISAPEVIAAGGSGTVSMWYYVPLSYSDDDLRGAIYANVVNATSQLILTMPGFASGLVAVQMGADSTLSMYQGGAAGDVSQAVITNTSYNIFQYYFDQLPISKSGVLLPITDLATVYELKFTLQNSVSQLQDFGYQYANFRNFLSTIAVWVNGAGTPGTVPATPIRTGGTDVAYWSLQAANTTNIWKKSPALLANEFRNFFQTDLPPGCYYFGSRMRPIVTTQYGNMQLILNATIANPGNYQLIGVEDFAMIQTLSMAGSLPTS
jgi:hypothetical protein